ncbi:AbrB/MazE/SpoVT family DNA-binding domain-containing protein [Metabacillus sp. Hm71]|uniref:AbrB/MazE/SpoVT family DNA-binding domain-containing protein n=1 Tax=Metabacillus sp. Hm71 TaxID=3450743 RepID=UPI003F43BFE3
MKATGVVRKVDELGRIVLPIELRRVFRIGVGDPVEIYVNNDQIILKKFKEKKECIITGEISDENLIIANGKITLSREGANLLMKELEQCLEKV